MDFRLQICRSEWFNSKICNYNENYILCKTCLLTLTLLSINTNIHICIIHNYILKVVNRCHDREKNVT